MSAKKSALSPELGTLVEDLKLEAAEKGLLLNADKLEYGYRLYFPGGGNRGSFSIYYSPRRRRYSLVAPELIDPDLIPLVELSAARTGAASPFQQQKLKEEFTSWESVLSDNPMLSRHIADKLSDLQAAGYFMSDFKKLQGGVQLELLKDETPLKINLYAGKDGRIKVVPSGKRTKERVEVAALLASDVSAKETLPKGEQKLDTWIGTDEAGKGDYFGSLVAAGFLTDWAIAEELEGMGLTDSKRMSDKRLLKLVKFLWGKYPDRCVVVEITPTRYNELYDGFRGSGGKLNQLLGWAHARVIREFHGKASFAAVVIDQFGASWNITRHLQEAKDVKLLLRPRAESNPAVAAASILARARFLRRLEKLSEEMGIDLPPGAGQKVIDAGKALVEKHGSDALSRAAKLHFKTTEKIMEGFD